MAAPRALDARRCPETTSRRARASRPCAPARAGSYLGWSPRRSSARRLRPGDGRHGPSRRASDGSHGLNNRLKKIRVQNAKGSRYRLSGSLVGIGEPPQHSSISLAAPDSVAHGCHTQEPGPPLRPRVGHDRDEELDSLLGLQQRLELDRGELALGGKAIFGVALADLKQVHK